MHVSSPGLWPLGYLAPTPLPSAGLSSLTTASNDTLLCGHSLTCWGCWHPRHGGLGNLWFKSSCWHLDVNAHSCMQKRVPPTPGKQRWRLIGGQERLCYSGAGYDPMICWPTTGLHATSSFYFVIPLCSHAHFSKRTMVHPFSHLWSF